MYQAIKQLEEKNVANEVDMLLWSDRMDLVAVANIKGEVALHRLTWVRAWCLTPYKEGIRVKSMAWKPDGQVIGVGYSTGHVLLVSVENKTVLHKIEVNAEISSMVWIKEKNENKNNDKDDQKSYMKYLDYSSKFLPDPPPLTSFTSTSASEQNVSLNLQTQTELNLLIIGTAQGLIFISVFGCTPCAVLDLNQHLGYQCSVLNVLLSEDLDLMLVSIKDEFKKLKVVILSTVVFKSHTRELFAVAMKYEYLNCLVNYIDSTILVIKETWENILLEMDAKLSKYASKVPEGTLSADFLDLLTFGIATDHMQEFLLHDLTKKGLEKFGQTIEMSYANIQKLLLKNVTKVGQNITYHLAELRGMARLDYRYEALGLAEDSITKAIASNGAFLNKSGEMQQIINMSMINYKAFFRWLYTAIMHLIDEQVPPEIPKLTQQDLVYITEFLQNFDDIVPKHTPSGSRKPGFIMEKLGQYLIDSPLTIPSTIDTNEWNVFLSRNECVRNHPNLIKHFKDTSLVQQFNHLKDSIGTIFEKPKSSMIERFTVKKIIDCIHYVDGPLKITKVNYNASTVLIVFLSCRSPADALYFLELTTINKEINGKAGYIFVPQFVSHESEILGENYHMLDLQFYTHNVLSVLMQENNTNKTGLIYQCPAVILREKIKTVDLDSEIGSQDLIKINAHMLGNSLIRTTEGMVAVQFAVSGCRRVAVVLAESRRKVRIYEMEAEEEDEDDIDMSTSVVRDSDVE